MTHFHTLYGIPGYGLEWTDDQHETPADAWGAVFTVLEDNWQKERDTIKADPARFGHVQAAYTRAMILSLELVSPGRVHIPSLDRSDMGLTLGVTACTDAHLRLIKEETPA